uniref:fibropellin-3-like n=1 Tax=Ciona intestinalis TaxID=7719 RepID=UPI000EF4FE44|nr:fibropellin-3-like [Ciona intestinalis]|eukprot:XP_026692168.1 fibropellin-3-like [Ciona intestinalis]
MTGLLCKEGYTCVRYHFVFYVIPVFLFGICLVSGQDCGGDLPEPRGIIKTPGFPTEENPTSTYPSNTDCYWLKEGGQYTLVQFKFWALTIENGQSNSNASCEYDYLNLTITSVGSTIFCGFFTPTGEIRGFGSLYVHFHSDDSVNYRGFTASYQTVENFNPCEPNPCINDGECEIGSGIDRVCKCKAGFLGEYCEIDIKECDSDPCQNGGTCSDDKSPNHYACECPRQWDGTNCEEERGSPCEPNPCQYGGTCENVDYLAICTCKPGYDGETCEIKTGCGNPGIPYLDEHRRFDTGTSLQYSCIEKYVMEGKQNTTCLSNGTWSNEIPNCILNGTQNQQSSDGLTSWSRGMIVLGSVLTVNIAVFGTWMWFKSPWAILERLGITGGGLFLQQTHSINPPNPSNQVERIRTLSVCSINETSEPSRTYSHTTPVT